MMTMSIIDSGIEVPIVNMIAIWKRQSGSGYRFIIVCVPIFEHNPTFGGMNMTAISCRDRRTRNIETLMTVSLLTRCMRYAAMIMLWNKRGVIHIIDNPLFKCSFSIRRKIMESEGCGALIF